MSGGMEATEKLWGTGPNCIVCGEPTTLNNQVRVTYKNGLVVIRHGSCELPNKPDSVNHPKHYTSHPSGIECIQIVRHMNFNLGNAIKYIWRAGLKTSNPEALPNSITTDFILDLEKAKWYLDDEIARLKGELK